MPGCRAFSFLGVFEDGEVIEIWRWVPQRSHDADPASEGWQEVITGPMPTEMGGGIPSQMGPMPGDPAGAMGMAGFAGGAPMAQPLQTDVQEQLRAVALQLREWHRAVDSVMQGVQGVSTSFPQQQGDGAQKITALADAFKKELTTFVMGTIRQAPSPGVTGPQMPVMAG